MIALLAPHARERRSSPESAGDVPPVTALFPTRRVILWPGWLPTAAASLVAASEVHPAQSTPPVDTLEAELLSQPPAIGQPGFLQPWGEHLLVSDWLGDPNLHVLDRETGELIVSFGRIGRGPGEFPNALPGIQRPWHDTTATWVFDGRKLTRVETPGPIGRDPATVDLTAVPLVLRAAWMDSTTILGVTWEPPERRFVFFDETGRVTREVPGDLLGHDGVPESVRAEASASFSLCTHPGAGRFALVYKRAARVRIYDGAAKHVLDAHVPYAIDATFEEIDGEIRFVPEWITYQSCWASSDFLYAVYSGDRYTPASAGSLGGEEIHVFDWNSGRLVKMFHLDTRIFGIAVDEDSGWLYGGSLQDAGIYRFPLASGGREEC